MADLIIMNGVVVTLDRDRRVIEHGAVAIEADRIVAVGTAAEIQASHRAAETIDAGDMAIMPGLVDAHAHAGHGLVKTMGSTRPRLWYEMCERIYASGTSVEFWRAEAQLAALERLHFGVTTGVSLLGGGDSVMRTDDPAFGDAHCAGVVEVGTRSVVVVGSTRPPHPWTYARWEGTGSTQVSVSFEKQVETCIDLIDRWHRTHGERIILSLLTPVLRLEQIASMDTASLEVARRQAIAVRELGRERGLVFMQDGHAGGSIRHLHDMGLLGPDVLLSHCTNLTQEEISICADTDTKIAHNPSAIASILGRCPVTELISAGVTVALGSDATAPDRSGDMFRHMQLCMHYHRTFHRDGTWLPPGRVLEMCTIDGARALGLEREIGSLEVGKKADIVLLNLRKPHLYPPNMPVYRLTCFANGNDVDTVIVNGRVRLAGGRAVGIDEEAILDAAGREAALMVERTGYHDLLETPETFWRSARLAPQ